MEQEQLHMEVSQIQHFSDWPGSLKFSQHGFLWFLVVLKAQNDTEKNPTCQDIIQNMMIQLYSISTKAFL